MLRLVRRPSRGALVLTPVLEGGGARPPGFAARIDEVLELGPEHWLVGADAAVSAPDWERVGAAAIAALGERGGGALEARKGRIALDARGLREAAALALGAGALLRAWRFEALKSKPAPGPRRIELVLDDPDAAALPWARLRAALDGALFARELTAEPANRLGPRRLARRLAALDAEGIAVEVLKPRELRRLGAGALLAVGGAAAEGPRLVLLRWKGRFAAPPVAFVGKGLCFDTGGVSIKPARGMAAMRADMAGAAACAGAMLALARRNSPCPAVAVLALAENATGARSYRPGDVLRTLSGRTVEVLDTDAEGRLVLADALHLAATRFRPQALLDLATLTGSVVTALGHHRAGLFGNDAALGAALAAAGEAVGERLWPLPIGEAHRAELASDIADLRQCVPQSGDGRARLLPDASHAAAFLREFVGRLPWAHLDIAGVDTAEEGGAPTGFGARLLDALVERHFEDPHRV